MTHGEMETSYDLRAHDLLALTRTSFNALRSALLREGVTGATHLQNAGFAGGEAIYLAFRGWARQRLDGGEPGELTTEEFAALASEFFRDLGWGTFQVTSVHDSVAMVDSSDWHEADPASRLDHPGCHLTTGMLAGFFACVGDAPIAALEVECRSAGAARCRFLVGAGPVLTQLFEQIEQGVGYEEAMGSFGDRE